MKMIKIPNGSCSIGTDYEDGFDFDKEGPSVNVKFDEFLIGETTVTNSEFAQFVEETGYVTDAEQFGNSFVFHYFLSMDEKISSTEIPGLNWWLSVKGADWRHPEGINSTILNRMTHPVVHVSRNDALAYCDWIGGSLPTEMEWEVAGKGGLLVEKYPWGDDNFLVGTEYQCNIWQGKFPLENSKEDGFLGTAPAKWYQPNGYGLYQMIGNVWEWCLNPKGIELSDFQKYDSKYFQKYENMRDDQYYAIKGGSFLCHKSYCKRYRLAARNGNSGRSSSNNTGFRVIHRT